MKLFDSHCHLNFPDFDQDRNQVTENCVNNGVTGLCIPATKSADWTPLTTLTPTPQLRQYVALGLHPCFITEHQMEDIDLLDELLNNNDGSIAAIGETGLDFYDHQLPEDVRNLQITLFIEQVRLSKNHQLPLVIHARKCHDQILKVLRQHKPEAGGIIHAFSGSEQQAKQYIAHGFRLGFGGGITYPRAAKTRHLASTLSLHDIVLETDAPDMPLSGYQGQRNSPERLPLIAECLAKLRGITIEEVADVTTSNCLKIFISQPLS